MSKTSKTSQSAGVPTWGMEVQPEKGELEKRNLYRFSAEYFIEADSLEEAREIFADESFNFAADANAEKWNENNRVVVIVDDLADREKWVKDEIKEDFLSYLEENPDIEDFDEYYQAQGCYKVGEIADSNTPVYYFDIDGLYYLYGNMFDEAFENAGIGNASDFDNYKQVAIYCYLEEQGFDYLRELEDRFDSKILEAAA